MVETEMEVDIAPHYGTRAYLDDDLIDYDTEAEKELDHENNPDLIHEGLLYADENATVGQQTHDDVEYFEEQEHDPRETADSQIGTDPVEQSSLDHESSHEIDYDVEDVSNLHAADYPSETRDLAVGEQDLDDDSRAEDILEAGKAGGQTEDQAEDEEISWEHEDDDSEEKLETVTEEVQLSTVADDQIVLNLSVVSPALEIKEQEQDLEHKLEHELEHKEQEQASSDLADESDYAGNTTHDVGVEEGLNEYEILEDDGSGQGESDTDSHQFPTITVQYKGDEFPCFSANSDGFFSQLSLLDESVKSVLEAFRQELTNELLAEDELVFQVDELGLEFSESCSSDLLATITLRQVVELFDVLVRNQDPGNTRSLYTYLFTRPSTRKRFGFLMESAAEGKGLDEVIHLFQSPMVHVHGADTGDDSAVDEDAATQLDETESADDGELTEASHVFDTFEPDAQINQVDINNAEPPRQPATISGSSATAMGESRDLEEEEIVVSDALAAEDDVGDGEDVEQDEQDEKEESVVVSRSASSAHDVSDGIIRLEGPEETTGVATTAVELERSEPDDIIGIDFDEPVELTTMNGADEDGDEVEHHDTQHDEMGAGVHDAETTTASVKDDDDLDILSEPAEMHGAEDGTEEHVPKDKVDEEAEDEIDWRDDAEPLLVHLDADTTSSTTKRARSGDENDAGDDQNVKRRRP
ncbi:hypothetical protein E4U53_000762 [Claviceps sorghi]|nr:hypothetical protein E4U53_000762 [Claviceps sorghi]